MNKKYIPIKNDYHKDSEERLFQNYYTMFSCKAYMIFYLI